MFFTSGLKAAVGGTDPFEPIRRSLPEGFDRLDMVAKAQYLEMMIFPSNYLLSSQGDRVAMGHSVEIRLPFLDYRLIEFMARVPSRWKILGPNEKHLLKKLFQPLLPPEIVARTKQPYRAPIADCLLNGTSRESAMDLLAERAIRRTAMFDPGRVGKLVEKLRAAENPSEVDSMALAGILSSQIIHQQFIEDFPAHLQPTVHPDVIVDRRAQTVP